MYCKNCGHELSENAGFCNKCGTAVKDRSAKKRHVWIWVVILIAVVASCCIGTVVYVNLIVDSKYINTETENTVLEEQVETEEEPEEILDEDASELTKNPEKTKAPEPTPTPENKKMSDAQKMKQQYEEQAKDIEEWADKISAEAMSQSEINRTSAQIFKEWDNLLNDVYDYLRDTMPEDEFEELAADELKWIAEKEDAIKKEGESWGTGSGRPMAENFVAIDYTAERCYYLISLIE